MTKAVFAIPLTRVTDGQRPSLNLVKDGMPLTLVKGGTKVLPNLTAVKVVTNFDACQSLSKTMSKVLFTFDHCGKDSRPSLTHL